MKEDDDSGYDYTAYVDYMDLDVQSPRKAVNFVIKSPRYTGGDFMFLYRFVRRRRPQILVHAITFEQLFGFL